MTGLTLDELKGSLFTQPRHTCCYDASRLLLPPSRGTDGQYMDWGMGQWMAPARDEWIFDIGDGGYAPAIRFCPFCGEELPR